MFTIHSKSTWGETNCKVWSNKHPISFRECKRHYIVHNLYIKKKVSLELQADNEKNDREWPTQTKLRHYAVWHRCRPNSSACHLRIPRWRSRLRNRSSMNWSVAASLRPAASVVLVSVCLDTTPWSCAPLSLYSSGCSASFFWLIKEYSAYNLSTITRVESRKSNKTHHAIAVVVIGVVA